MAARATTAIMLAAGIALPVHAGASSATSWQNMSTADRVATLNAISDGCHLPRRALSARGEEIHFRPEPNAKYENVDCVLKKLKSTPGLPMKMGFVNNEAYENETH